MIDILIIVRKIMTDEKMKDLLKEVLREHDREKSTEVEFLSMKEVCNLLHLQRQAIYARMANKDNKYGKSLPCHRAGKKLLFRKSDVLKFID